MKMVGHKTEAIYRRYAIADESMLRRRRSKAGGCCFRRSAADHAVVVPLRTGKVSTKSPGSDMPFEGVSVAELTERLDKGYGGQGRD